MGGISRSRGIGYERELVNFLKEGDWRAVDWLPEYRFCADGRVLRVSPPFAGRLIRTKTGASGYVVVSITANGKPSTYNLHRLICEAWHGARPSASHHAAHNDGNRLNNDPTNLRWATAKENGDDQTAQGTRARGSRQGLAKLSEEDVRSVIADYASGSATQCQLAERYGVHQGTIWKILNGRTWHHVA